MKATSVLTQINWSLARAGREERLVRGRGYYYLRGGEAHAFPASGIYAFETERSGFDGARAAVLGIYERAGITTLQLERLWQVGDVVETFFDAGGHPHGGGATTLYGEVVEAGPNAAKIVWESGLSNRVEQLREGIKLARDPSYARAEIEKFKLIRGDRARDVVRYRKKIGGH